MQLEILVHAARSGWSQPLPRELDSSGTLVIAFGAPAVGRDDDRSGVLAELRDAFPSSHIVGASTAGEIFGTKLLDDSLVVSVVRFDATRLACASSSIEASTSFDAGARLARALVAQARDIVGVFVLSEGVSVNGSELVRGVNSELPASAIVTGGLAADGERFGRTWVLDRGRPAVARVSAVALCGERVRIGHGSKGGWDLFGLERRVTRSVGNVLYELDDKPALALYKRYLGERAAGLPATALLFPLAIRVPGEHKQLVRTVLAVDEATQSLTFAGDVPEGSLAQLMRANLDRLVQGASDAGSAVRIDCRAPILSVAISCVGRRMVLGEHAEEELEATLEALPAGVRQVGFYSYGELSPFTNGRCDLHNQTMTLTVVGEA